MIQALLAAWKQEVDVSFFVPDFERVLNTCLAHGILLRRIFRVDALQTDCRISGADFRRLPKILHGLHCRVRIRRKIDPAKKIRAYLRRPFFLIGACAVLIWLFTATGIVWDIRILPGTLDHRALLQALETCGLYPGARISRLDPGQIKEQLITALPELSWVGIELDGACATIDYRLRTPTPTVIPNNEPCALYAKKDAVLTKLYVYQGKQIASVGQTVRKGDLLVSAEVPIGSEGNFILAHALADSEARTWYELTAEAPLTTAQKVYTGEINTQKRLFFFGNQIKLPFSYGKTGAEYDIIIERKKVWNGIPCELITEKRQIYELVSATLDPAVEIERLKAVLTATVEAGLQNGHIVSAEFFADVSEDSVSVTMRCECVEDIVVAEPYFPAANKLP